jgi:hypothetical protein
MRCCRSRSRARSSYDDRLRYYLDIDTLWHVLDSTEKLVGARMYLKTGYVHQIQLRREESIDIGKHLGMCGPVGAGAQPSFGLVAPVSEVLYHGTITVQPSTLNSKLSPGKDER